MFLPIRVLFFIVLFRGDSRIIHFILRRSLVGFSSSQISSEYQCFHRVYQFGHFAMYHIALSESRRKRISQSQTHSVWRIVAPLRSKILGRKGR